MLMLGLNYNETTEIMDAFWSKLTEEQRKPRIIDFIPHISPKSNEVLMSEETVKWAWGYLQ